MRRKVILVALYTILGFLNQFLLFTIRKDMKHFGLAVSEIGLVLIVPYLPWTVKFIFGIISDTFPIYGQRRRPYIIVTNIMAAIFTAVLTIKGLDLDTYIAYLFFVQFFSCFADVCYDSSMVEITKEEIHDHKGSFQTTMWLGRNCGRALAAGLGPVLWEVTTDGTVFGIEAALFLFQSFLGLLLPEKRLTKPKHNAKVVDTRRLGNLSEPKDTYCGLLKKTFSESIFYKLIIFNILTGLLPSAGLSMFYFLSDELHYTPKTMALLDFIGQVSQIIGVLFFKYGFRKFKIRKLYLYVTILSTLISILPIVITLPGKHCLIEDGGTNSTSFGTQNFTSEHCYLFEEFGLDSLPFAFSDDVFGEILDKLKNMPLLTLTGILCQQTVEGVAYSLSIGIQNWVVTVQQPINSALTHAMQIDHNNFRNLPLLLVLCSSLELLSICFIWFLPNQSISEISFAYKDRLDRKNLNEAYLEDRTFTNEITKEETDKFKAQKQEVVRKFEAITII